MLRHLVELDLTYVAHNSRRYVHLYGRGYVHVSLPAPYYDTCWVISQYISTYMNYNTILYHIHVRACAWAVSVYIESTNL